MKTTTRKEYNARINRVIDHIGANLETPLGLDELAAVAAFSPFHFHRIFKAMVGESVTGFINRLRLERAASGLINHPQASITEIALECGFSSSSHFARAFKRHFGVSASGYREEAEGKRERRPRNTFKQKRNTEQTIRKNGIMNGKNGNAAPPRIRYNRRIALTEPNQRRKQTMNVEVKNLPSYTVAYVRVMDGYKSQKIKPAFEKVMTWAGARDLLGPDTLVIGISLDNPEVTPADKCRYDACVTVPPGTKAQGDIGVYDIAPGKYVIYRTQGEYARINAQLGRAWDELMRDWFPDSGYQPDDRPCFEIYRETMKEMQAGKYIVDICEPIRPL